MRTLELDTEISDGVAQSPACLRAPAHSFSIFIRDAVAFHFFDGIEVAS